MPFRGDMALVGAMAHRVADLAAVPDRALGRIGFNLRAELEHEFAEGVDPYDRPWEPLAPSTEARGRHAPPLTDTGLMRGTVETEQVERGVMLSIPHPALPHQDGWSGPQGRGPARPLVPTEGPSDRWHDAVAEAVSVEMAAAMGAT